MNGTQLVAAWLVLVAVTSCTSRPLQSNTDDTGNKPAKIAYDADDGDTKQWMSNVEAKEKPDDDVTSQATPDAEEEEEEEQQDDIKDFKKKHKQLIIIGAAIMVTLVILFITNCINIFIAFNSSTKVDDDKKDKKDKSQKKKDSESKKSSSKSKKKSKPSSEKNRLKRSVVISESD